MHGRSNGPTPHTLNTAITFNNKIETTPKHIANCFPKHIANCFTKQFTNTVKHATHKTNRHIGRATHNMQGYNSTLTTCQVQEAIKQSKNNNSQGPDKLNIRHLQHIGPLGLAFLTSMFKTALDKNIIPHTWKLANIVPIPKPIKDTDKGTSYRPISLLSVIADTGEEPSSLHNSKHARRTHAARVQGTTLYSEGTTHTKWRRSRRVQPNGSTCANNHCSTRYEQSFRHGEHAHTNQNAATDKHSGTIIGFIANCVKGRKAYTTYINHTSKQRQFKTGISHGLRPFATQFNIYTSDSPPPSAPVQVMAYADDIAVTSTHTGVGEAKKCIQPYLHKFFSWTKQNNLLLNPDKTTCTLFTPNPEEYTSNLDLTINDEALPMVAHQKVLGLTLDPKLIYSTRIHGISVQAHKPLQIMKALTETGWGKQKETLMAT